MKWVLLRGYPVLQALYIFHNPAGFCFNQSIMQGGDM